MRRKAGPDDLQWSLPTPTILWFCEAVLHCWVLISIQLPCVKKNRCSRIHGTQHCCALILKSQEHPCVISLSYFICTLFFFLVEYNEKEFYAFKKGIKEREKTWTMVRVFTIPQGPWLGLLRLIPAAEVPGLCGRDAHTCLCFTLHLNPALSPALFSEMSVLLLLLQRWPCSCSCS